MSFMTEKKAQETFAQYMTAEEAGDDALAISLEKDLNDAGWFITSGPDGLTIKKKESTLPNIDPSLLPAETSVKPTVTPVEEEKKGSNVWLIVGIVAGVAVLTIGAILLIKHFKNVQSGAIPARS